YGLHRDLLLGPGRKRARGLLRAAPKRVEPAAAVLGTGRQGSLPRALGRSALADPGLPAGVAAGTGSRAGPTLVCAIADLLGAVRRGDAKAVGDLLAARPALAINAAAAGPRADRRPEIVELLIARGTPVDGRGSPAAHTPLHEAAFNGDLPLVGLLLASGADRSLRTGEGETALDIAVKQGRQ